MPFTCNTCNYSTNSSSEYREHLKSSEHIRKTEAKQKPTSQTIQPPPTTTNASLSFIQHSNNTPISSLNIKNSEPIKHLNIQKHPTNLPLNDQIISKPFPTASNNNNTNPHQYTNSNTQLGYSNIPTSSNIHYTPFYPTQNYHPETKPVYTDSRNYLMGGNTRIQEPYHHQSHQYYPNDSRTNYSSSTHSTHSTNSTNSYSSQEDDLISNFNGLNLSNNPSVSQHLNNWYCSLCSISCNSKEKYDEHVRGSKHQKKQKTFYQESAFTPYSSSNPIQNPIQSSTSPEELQREHTPPFSNPQIPGVQNNYPPKAQSPTVPEAFRIHAKYYSKTVVGTLEIYSCTLCNVDCNGPDVLLTHFNGKQHLKNVNREQINAQYTSPPPTISSYSTYTSPPPSHPSSSVPSENYSKGTSPPFVDNVEQPSIQQLISEGVVTIQRIGKQDGYICTACDMFCNSVDALQDHIKGRKHIKSYASFLAKNLVQQPQTNQFIPINPTISDEPEFDESRSVQILEYFWSQTFGQNMKPTYIETCYGPSHITSFRCEIDLSALKLTNQIGDGKTKKEAKKNACTKSCISLDQIGALKKAIPPYLYNPLSKK